VLKSADFHVDFSRLRLCICVCGNAENAARSTLCVCTSQIGKAVQRIAGGMFSVLLLMKHNLIVGVCVCVCVCVETTTIVVNTERRKDIPFSPFD